MDNQAPVMNNRWKVYVRGCACKTSHYVCMYVCMHACMHVCMYVYVYIYVCICMYMYLQHDTCANLSAIKHAPRYSSFGIPV